MMLLAAILCFTLMPVIEIYLLIQAGRIFGIWDTVAIVVATGVFGAWLARKQGAQILRASQANLRRGELPAEHLLQGMMVFVGGIFLVMPGFVTDILGLALVIPRTRRWLSRGLRRYLLRSIEKGRIKIHFGQVDHGGFYQAAQRDVTPKSPGQLGEVIDIQSARKKRGEREV